MIGDVEIRVLSDRQMCYYVTVSSTDIVDADY